MQRNLKKIVLIDLLVVLLTLAAGCRTERTLGSGWTVVTTAPTARGELAAAVLDDRLYVLGGLSGLGTTTDLVEVYDFAADEWQTAEPLPQPLNHLAATALNGRVYVFGGSTAFTSPTLTTAQAYDPTTGTWTAIAEMPERRWAAGAAAVGDKVYVVGGTGGESANVLEYDPESDTWNVRAPLSPPREHLAVVAFEGKVYAIGGRSDGRNLAVVEVYDPETDRWTALAPLRTPRSGLAGAVTGGRIVVAGGENPALLGGRVFPNVEVYDPATDRWSDAPPLPTPRHGVAGAGHDGMALFIGGSGRQGALSPTAWSAVVEGYRP